MINFEKFTEDAQQIAVRTIEILHRYQHNQTDVSHMILALLEARGSLIVEILNKASVDVDNVLQVVTHLLENTRERVINSTAANSVFITPHLKRVIEQSATEAHDLHDEFVGIEHLLLAILLTQHTALRRMLDDLNVTYLLIRDTLLAIRSV